MKPRRVVLTIEVDTDQPIATIRKATTVVLAGRDARGEIVRMTSQVLQIQANVITSKVKS